VTISRFCFECNNGEVLADLAAMGEGVVLLPEFIVKPALGHRTLVPILSGWHPPQLWLTATYPPYAILPAKVSAFTSFIEDAIGPDMLRA
jgi:DNA-binding transcriptional LysR family regulator